MSKTTAPTVLTAKHELFMELLEEGDPIAVIADKLECSRTYAYRLGKQLKDEILERQRDRLVLGTVKAVNTMVDMMSADANTEKGELRLKASADIMDRAGLTRHTAVDVQIESTNGIFLLPGKSIVPTQEALEASYEDITPET